MQCVAPDLPLLLSMNLQHLSSQKVKEAIQPPLPNNTNPLIRGLCVECPEHRAFTKSRASSVGPAQPSGEPCWAGGRCCSPLWAARTLGMSRGSCFTPAEGGGCKWNGFHFPFYCTVPKDPKWKLDSSETLTQCTLSEDSSQHELKLYPTGD